MDVQGVADRDQVVVQRVRTRGVPIAIITGAGYTRNASSVVAHSLLSLYHLGLISGPATGITVCKFDSRYIICVVMFHSHSHGHNFSAC